jgi:glycerophosphoryl diester phosphodiesterase
MSSERRSSLTRSPKSSRLPDVAVVVLGHRGGRGSGWPAENTLEAFERALAEGADGVELDVRLCGSGDAIVLHDRCLGRVTNGADTRGVHLVRRVDLPRLAGGERIPDLAAALDACKGRVVNVEVKADVPSRLRLVGVVARELGRARPVEVVVSSFDPVVVLAFAVVAPRVPRALLVGPRTAPLATALPLSMRRAIVDAHLDDGLVYARRVERLRAADLRVVTWTVNDPARAKELADMGVGALITDRPKDILTALRGDAATTLPAASE